MSERVGNIGIDYTELALSRKFTRKQITIWNDELVSLRELNIVNGALGGATWDGGVILARWIARNGDKYFSGKICLELGCGVGIGSCVASRYAKKLVYTDYIEEVVKNAKYNVEANCTSSCEIIPYVLDWNDALKEEIPHTHSCSNIENSNQFKEQDWFRCPSCFPDIDCGVCTSCYQAVHAAHPGSSFGGHCRFKCDCTGQHKREFESHVLPNSFDILFGSELTYNYVSCEALAATVDLYLKPDGAFYEILSMDREGVDAFCECMTQRNFICYRNLVPSSYYNLPYCTRVWSRQADEKYCFYTWKRANSELEVMDDHVEKS